jgi:hypothetical protein
VEAAVARARASGRRVRVDADTTPTRQSWANPDGSFTAELTPVPVRALVNGAWAPLDTTLHTAGGVVAPRSAADRLAFSAGGTGFLARLGAPGRAVELRWLTALPAPVVRRDTATYPEVFPGVDLVLRATRQGYAETVVVKTREAGTNPAVRAMRFGLAGDGLTARLNKDGTLDAVDRSGAVVWASPAPSVWDRSGPVRAPQSRTAQGRFAMDGGVLTVVAPTAFLDDPAAVYPVAIDPDWGAPMQGWAEVYLEHPDDHYWGGDGDNVAKVGFTDWPGSPIVTVRSYYQFDLSFLFGRQIIGAEFNDRENWSPSCDPRPVELHETGQISPGTSWHNQPWIGQMLDNPNVAHGHDANCPPEPVGFDAKGAVVNAVNAHFPTTTLMLKAINESDDFAWKKFDSNPSLVVTYNSFPDIPKSPVADVPLNPNLPCSQTVDAVKTNATTGLRAHVTVTDPDGGSVNALFRWYNWDTGADLGYSGWVPAQQSGSVFTATVPDKLLTDGAHLGWRVLAGDGMAASKDWSTPCEITIDRVKPSPASISSDIYLNFDPATQDGVVSGGIGKTGLFTFRPGADPDVSAFAYTTTDHPAPVTVPMDTASRTAVVGISPARQGPMDVTVRAVDRAGNQSATAAKFHAFVGPGTAPVAYWRLDGTGSESAAPELTGRHNATLQGTSGWTTGRVGDALFLNGSTGWLTTDGGQAVRTDTSFTVSAWVKLAALGTTNQTAVSQDGTGTLSAFQLGYRGDVGRWGFVVPSTSTSITGSDVVTGGTPVVGEWTHLVGEFDSGAKEIRLYVNGTLAGRLAHTATWDGPGPVEIGRSVNTGAPTIWNGAVDEVKIYDRLLSTADNDDRGRAVLSEVHSLAVAPVAEDGFWPLDDGTGTVAADISGNYRAGTLGSGVSWGPGTVGTGAAVFTGAPTGIDIGGPVLNGNQSFSVSARVSASSTSGTGNRFVVSQDGTALTSSDFALYYQGGAKAWTFAVRGAGSVTAVVELPVNTWTAVTGVYDAPAQQLRLYLNGQVQAKVNVTAAASMAGTGTFVIGRGRVGTTAAGGWLGAIDDVHVFRGVLSDGSVQSDASLWPGDTFPTNRILTDYLQPRTGPDTPYAGQFSLHIGQAGQRIVTTGAPPPGYHFQQALGLAVAPGTPGTHLLYSCLNPTADWLLSLRADCEGLRVLGVAGAVYDAAPAGIPSRPLYRCHSTTAHTVSNTDGCGGAPWVGEGLLGYAVDRATLVRSRTPSDSAADTAAVPGMYRTDAALGLLGGGRRDRHGTADVLPAWHRPVPVPRRRLRRRHGPRNGRSHLDRRPGLRRRPVPLPGHEHR